MNTRFVVFKILSILMLLALALGAGGSLPVLASQTGPESPTPAGLSAADWSQIRSLLHAALPAQLAYTKASNTGANDDYGFSVAVSGDTVVVGAYGEDSNATGVNNVNQGDNSASSAGAAYVFTRSGTTWSQQAYLKASNTGAGDWFGYSVAISGDTLVIGAPAEASNATGVNGNELDNSAASAGAAYVFTRSGTTWSQQAYLKASNTEVDDYFGWSVAIDGDTLVVGAILEASNATGVNGNQANNLAADSGAAYVFTRTGTTWSQQAYLKASNTDASDYFGISTAISGNTAVVGAYGEDSNATGVNNVNQGNNSLSSSGAVYVFTRSGTTWSQEAYVKASNTDVNDRFGNSITVSGDTLVVGAYLEGSNATGVNGDGTNNLAPESGAAYVFTRAGTTWSQQAYLKASNTDALDKFGWSVGLSGNTAIIGAEGEGSNATGVNGNQEDDSASSSGAAYLFTRSGGTWSQQAYLKASNTGASDNFGSSIAISGNTVVVGAWQEDSNTTGVNGNQADNSASNSGAAYVYLQKSTSTYQSVGTYDGYILESGENTNVGGTLDSTSTSFNLGDGAGDKQYRAILSFNTAALPDTAVITKVTLKIKRPATGFLIGNNNPFTWGLGLKVDMRKPFFGTTAALVISDFQATPGKSTAATFGATPVSGWYTAVIGAAGWPYINKTGTTQFRLRFATDDNNDNAADYMKFYSGNYAGAASRPALVIEYYLP